MKYTIKKEYWTWTEEFDSIDDVIEEVLNLEEHHLKEQFDEMLNDIYGMVKLGGYEYDHAIAWERTDEIAYRQGFLSYVNSAIWRSLKEEIERMEPGEELEFYGVTITCKEGEEEEEEEEEEGESK